MDGAVTDGLSAAIVNIVRQMRHDGIRLVVGTQSPRALAPELLELVTVGVIHRFHSMDWFNYLKAKIPLEDAAWSRIRDLYPGEALVFASRHQIGVSGKEGTTPFGQNIFEMKIRPRLTTDVGGSLVNKQSSKTAKK